MDRERIDVGSVGKIALRVEVSERKRKTETKKRVGQGDGNKPAERPYREAEARQADRTDKQRLGIRYLFSIEKTDGAGKEIETERGESGEADVREIVSKPLRV